MVKPVIKTYNYKNLVKESTIGDNHYEIFAHCFKGVPSFSLYVNGTQQNTYKNFVKVDYELRKLMFDQMVETKQTKLTRKGK